MPVAQYGTTEIHYSHIIDTSLKHGYITVDFYEGVVLKTPPIENDKADQLVISKGRWIMDKVKLVERIPQGEIITGSRLLYLGRRYYVQVTKDPAVKDALVRFTQSKLNIAINPDVEDRTSAIDKALENFTRDKAKEKILPRVKKWSETTGLIPNSVNLRKLSKRWGSCNNDNDILINFDAVKLPFSLIDYIIIHELTHIKHKDHSKDFYRELSKYAPDWEDMDERLGDMKL
ncbi:Metal-dependent hydrolase family protein [Desulfamplus magnetovallimortis]|uniref:Metal-dependent hydrolase family protein n=1 Tax=Desulfamplus magnetovallimortis TaxID=1246637 RepID=A0A1W1HF47_9BACT|nr:SprT family zinc-dependent metalloprotease [Desulfamplus magnetovallimortis]SLM31056.1 Metal-dependent hydrolase family protein [Desulfamplus magnetovallimortis]